MTSPSHVACPLCGGPVHPIAGRCKHCRADLVEARRGSPVATPDPEPIAAPKRRTWIFAIALGSVAATGTSLWLVTGERGPADHAPAAVAAIPAPPAPRTEPAITSYRELLEAAIDAGCARLTGCGAGLTAECEKARNALANPALTCRLDHAAAAACVAAIAKVPCSALDASTWPEGIRKLPGCEAVCAP